MKDFGGPNADATKEAFIAACAKFGDMEVLRKKITCLCADRQHSVWVGNAVH